MLPQDISQDFKDAASELLEYLEDHQGQATIAQLAENTEIKPALFIELLKFFCDHKLIKPLGQDLFKKLTRAANQVAGRASKNPAKLLVPAWRHNLEKNFNDTVEVKEAEDTPLSRLDDLFESRLDKAHEKLEANGNELLSILSGSEEGMQLATLAQLAKMPAEDFLDALRSLSKTKQIDPISRTQIHQLKQRLKKQGRQPDPESQEKWLKALLRQSDSEAKSLKRPLVSQMVKITQKGQRTSDLG